ncbi:MAG: hypothetical protein Tsb005_00130 [Gammaproteobacteria bacterium]
MNYSLNNCSIEIVKPSDISDITVLISDLIEALHDVICVEELANNILYFLASRLGLKFGISYLVKTSQLKPLSQYGLKPQVMDNFPYKKINEALILETITTRSYQTYEMKDDISDYLIHYDSTTKTTKLKKIILWPLIYQANVISIFELGFTHETDDQIKEFLSISGPIVGLYLANYINQARLENAILLNQLHQQELNGINKELHAKAKQLQASESNLHLQREILRHTNQELSNKIQHIEQQYQSLNKNWRILKQKTRSLKKEHEHKNESLTNTIYELSNQMICLLSLTNNLSKNNEENLTAMQIDMLKNIEYTGNHLFQLTNNILDFSKPEIEKSYLFPANPPAKKSKKSDLSDKFYYKKNQIDDSLILQKTDDKNNSTSSEPFSTSVKPDKVMDYHILIIETDVLNAFNLSKILTKHNLHTIIANCGKLALEKLTNQHNINIVLVDIITSDRCGYETIQLIRSESKWSDIPIVAISVDDSETNRKKSLAEGANAFLAKPFGIDTLLKTISPWLNT